MPRVIHFEIYVDDVQRAIKFYDDTFGWKSQGWEGPQEYFLVTTGDENQPGITGAIMKRPGPGATGVNYIEVPSVDEFIQKTVAGGGSVTMPNMAIPGVGYAAHCQDTEGNPFGLFQDDSSAS